jgi:beta-phosphoglucomutase-like phosphatase (HAD superfamily)
VVTAERAGFYKPHPRAYRLALEELNVEPARALFVAGSPADLPGATNVGMPVFWHNLLGLSSLDASVHPKFISDSLWPLIELAVGGNAKCETRTADCGIGGQKMRVADREVRSVKSGAPHFLLR